MNFSLVESLRLLVLLASGFLVGTLVNLLRFYQRMSLQKRNRKLPHRMVVMNLATVLLILSEMAEQATRFVRNDTMTWHLPVLLVVIPAMILSLRQYMKCWDQHLCP